MYALTGHKLSVHLTPTIGESEGSLTELGVHLDGGISVLQRFWQSRQFGIPVRSVIVPPRIVRIPLDTFRISLDGTSEIALLEQSVPFLPGLSRFLWIDIRKLLGIGLGAFSLAKLVEDVGRSVLCERFVEVLDSRSQVSGLGVSGSNTSVSLSDEFIVRTDLGGQSYQLALDAREADYSPPGLLQQPSRKSRYIFHNRLVQSRQLWKSTIRMTQSVTR